MKWSEIDSQSVQAIRFAAIDSIEKSKSGHPGLPMGAALFCYILFKNHLRFHPDQPDWVDRDRFILSAGHGSALLYSLIHFFYQKLSLEDLKSFRQINSKTPGHPEFDPSIGIEATTGPLGQGAANAVGFAMAQRYFANQWNLDFGDLFQGRTFALVSDGDLTEGVALEAASLGSLWKLKNLFYLYDSNDVTLDGPASLSMQKGQIADLFRAKGWEVFQVHDASSNPMAVLDVFEKAIQSTTEAPKFIEFKTVIGFGSPTKSGKSSVHGSPLGAKERQATAEALQWPHPDFYYPNEIYENFEKIRSEKLKKFRNWDEKFSKTLISNPEIQKKWSERKNLKKTDSNFKSTQAQSTRKLSGIELQNRFKTNSNWMVGDADLSCSTLTGIPDEKNYPDGRSIRYGIREHAMAAIANGISYFGEYRPIVSTFFCFSDYLKPALRVAALSHLPVIYVFTHDSIGLGEDGPTHQPIEHLAALRALPNIVVIRPADSIETTKAWEWLEMNANSPTAFVLSRQDLPVLPLEKDFSFEDGARIIIRETKKCHLVIIATGSEVGLGFSVASKLLESGFEGIRLVSLYSWELFEKNSEEKKDSIIPRKQDVFCISIEAGSTLGWDRYTGQDGIQIGINSFGASAPMNDLYEKFGFTVDAIVKKITKKLKK